MGFLKSLKDKMSNKDEQVQSRGRYSTPSLDQKYTYVNQAQQPKLTHEGLSEVQVETDMPPGPPSSYNVSTNNPPPYESWLTIPDTSDFPPPPKMSNESSVAGNATFADAELGHRWCAEHDVYTPAIPQHPTIVELCQAGELDIDIPVSGFGGSVNRLDNHSWEVRTDKGQQDTLLMSKLPVYLAAVSNPLSSGTSSGLHTGTGIVTFSFRVTISKLHRKAGIAIGFSCKPYPHFRLPGWHRGSLAVHSDDGNRYVNDPYGGVDFTRPFQIGDQIKMTMSIHPFVSPVQQYHGPWSNVKRVGSLPKCITRVQVERNGQAEGSWDIHEERDGEQDEGIEGLQGEADLYCAVGIFGLTSFVVHFEDQPPFAQKRSSQ